MFNSVVCDAENSLFSLGWKVLKHFLPPSPLMSESLSLKSLSPLPLSFTLCWSLLPMPLQIQSTDTV